MSDEERWIAYEPVAELLPDARNPKGHDLASLDDSFGRFGYVEPVVVDERTGQLVAGHGRVEGLLARHAAGKTPPPGVTVDSDGTWRLPVVHGWRSADDAEAAAYLIAANRLTERGGWELEPLSALLQLVSEGPGLLGTGYGDEDLSDILRAVGEPPTLEQLEAQLGPPAPDAFWPTLRFKVSPALKQRYDAVVAGVEGEEAQLELLVSAAEERARA